jgi:hypothetical protein
VLALELVAFQLSRLHPPAQSVEFIPALSGFRTKSADALRGGLADCAETTFEIEARQPFRKDAKFVEYESMRALFLGLDPLDNAHLDFIKRRRGTRRFILGASLCPTGLQRQFGSDPTNV